MPEIVTVIIERSSDAIETVVVIEQSAAPAGVAPAAHAPSHAADGDDPLTLTEAQVTGLVADLAAKAASSHQHAGEDVTSGTVAAARLGTMTGDGGAGGTKGAAPAPSAGDAAAGRFLKADGTWDVPAGSGSGDVVGPSSAVADRISVFNGTTGKLIKDGGATIANVLARANHTGTQTLSTISDAGSAAAQASSAFATAAQGATADAALPKAGGQMSGNITMAGAQTVDGRDLSTDGTKLDGIETGADVTDAVNVGTSVDGATAKTTPVDADTMPIIDSAASNVLKKVTWANIKATLKSYFDTLYNLYVHPNHSGDVTSVADGAQTIAAGAVSLAKMANLAQDQFIGRTTASMGVPETATITAAARTVLDDATVAAMVDTLGGAEAQGTGGIVRATSPTLTTPLLGTPTSGTLTNCTGLPQAGTVGLTTADSPQFAGVNVGHASDTTVGRAAAGVLAIEGVAALGGAEATVASATTTDLGALASELVSITGTTTITGFGTVAAGTKRQGRFTGALTLTHNATSLMLPGATNITTAAGDRFEAVSLGSGNWVVYWYQKADGTAVVGGGASDSVVYVLGVGTGLNLGDSTAYYYGISVSWIASTPNIASLRIPRNGTITRVEYYASFAAAGSAEDVNHYVRLNDSTDNCNAVADYDSATLTASCVWTGSLAITAGDNIIIKVLTPAWATNPTTIKGYALITFDPT